MMKSAGCRTHVREILLQPDIGDFLALVEVDLIDVGR